MNKSNQRIRKFNPGTFQSDEEVIEQFEVRKRELNIVLEVLRGISIHHRASMFWSSRLGGGERLCYSRGSRRS